MWENTFFLQLKSLLPRTSLLTVPRILNDRQRLVLVALCPFSEPLAVLPFLCSPSQTFILSFFSNLLSENDLINSLSILYLPDKIKRFVSKGYLRYIRWKKELSGCEILDDGDGKGRICCGQGPLLSDYEIILCMRLPSENTCFRWMCQRPETFSRGKILLHYMQCKNKIPLGFTIYPKGLVQGYAIWIFKVYFRNAFPLSFQKRLIVMKFQTIILTQG